MFSYMIFAAAIAAAEANAPPASTPTVVVKGHLIRARDGEAKVDTTVHVDDEDVSDRYGPIWPSKGYEQGASGRVTLACRVNAQGFAQSCDVASETPLNMGFGEAALQLQPSLRVSPPASALTSGSAVMNIAVKFDLGLDGLYSTAPGQIPRTGAYTNRRTNLPVIMEPVTMVSHPIWSAAPSFDDMRRVYPSSAKAADGFVVLRCKVEKAGTLGGCDVTKEEPERQGFNRAALSLAPFFRIAPEVMARAPKAKALQVVLPIHFVSDALKAEPVVDSPSWVSGLDPQREPNLFPADAIAHGITTGRGVARCIVGSDGTLTDCSPEAADSDDAGFSDAAAVVAATMKMNLWSADASPVRGGVVHIPVRLNLAPQT